MPSVPTPSDFADLEERVRELQPVGQQLARMEATIDALQQAVRSLMVFEERQANQAQRFRDLADTTQNNRTHLENRIAAIAERFDARMTELEKKHQATATELYGYVQRYLGWSAAIGGALVLFGTVWAVASRFIHTT